MIRRGSGRMTREQRLGQHRKAETLFAARLSRRASMMASSVKVMVFVIARVRVKAKLVQLTTGRGMHCSLLGRSCGEVSPLIPMLLCGCMQNSLGPSRCSFGLKCIFWQRVELATCDGTTHPSRAIPWFSTCIALKVSLS